MERTREQWFVGFRKKAELTANNLHHMVEDVDKNAGHVMGEDFLVNALTVAESIGNLMNADSDARLYEVMKVLSEYSDAPSLMCVALMAFTELVLDEMITELKDIDGTRDEVLALEYISGKTRNGAK